MKKLNVNNLGQIRKADINKLSAEVISLPMHSELSENQVQYIAEQFLQYYHQTIKA